MFWGVELRPLIELDSLRFFAIGLVVLHHQVMDFNPFMGWMKKFGWSGVEIFFTLSGFLITSILLKELERKKSIEIVKFWTRRALRLWPSWLVVLIATHLVIIFFFRHHNEIQDRVSQQIAYYYLHLANYSAAINGCTQNLLCHYWSLAVEEHFYLIWPPLLLLFMRYRTVRPLIFILMLAAPYAFRIYHSYELSNMPWIRQATHSRIDSIAWGCFLALYFEKLPKLRPISDLAVSLVSATLFYFAYHYMYLRDDQPLIQYGSYTLLSLATCLLIWIALKGSEYGLRAILKIRLLAWFGIMSYGIYLVHFLTNLFVFGLVKKASIDIDSAYLVAINCLLPLGGAVLLYHLVDKPFASIKAKLH